MNIKHILLLTCLAFTATCLQAQSNLPQTTVGGHQFYYYDVSSGESIYDIAAKIGSTKDDMTMNEMLLVVTVDWALEDDSENARERLDEMKNRTVETEMP